MGETLASSFASVFMKEVPTAQEPHQTFDGSIDAIRVTAQDVLSHLRSLDTNSAMGPDFIHPLVLKNCSDVLTYPLHVIFNRSIVEGTVPSAWKRSNVIPLFNPPPPGLFLYPPQPGGGSDPTPPCYLENGWT